MENDREENPNISFDDKTLAKRAMVLMQSPPNLNIFDALFQSATEQLGIMSIQENNKNLPPQKFIFSSEDGNLIELTSFSKFLHNAENPINTKNSQNMDVSPSTALSYMRSVNDGSTSNANFFGNFRENNGLNVASGTILNDHNLFSQYIDLGTNQQLNRNYNSIYDNLPHKILNNEPEASFNDTNKQFTPVITSLLNDDNVMKQSTDTNPLKPTKSNRGRKCKYIGLPEEVIKKKKAEDNATAAKNYRESQKREKDQLKMENEVLNHENSNLKLENETLKAELNRLYQQLNMKNMPKNCINEHLN